jgi:branched-chain amino acid transport system ATP-binding protein
VEPYKLIKIGFVHVPEARRLFVEMSVEENLDMGSLKGKTKMCVKQPKNWSSNSLQDFLKEGTRFQ